MRLKFWGTRGSLAKPGPDTLRYGGNTSCVSFESDGGTLIVIDSGTGAQALGQNVLAEREAPRHGHMLISHTHWDHIQGFPFFAPLFVPGDEWDIYGPGGLGVSLRETLSGQMQYNYFPITLDALGAETRFHSLIEGSFEIGDIRIQSRYLNHPVLTLGYRLEADGVVIVYACDHEPHAREAGSGQTTLTGQDLAHVEFLADADLVIHDAQFTAAEYSSKHGWGHSTAEYVTQVAQLAGAKRVALTHHDPMRSDDALDEIVDHLQASLNSADSALEVFAAAEGLELELSAPPSAKPEAAATNAEAVSSALRDDSALAGHRVLLCMADSPAAEGVVAASDSDGVEVVRCDSADEAQALFAVAPTSVVVVDGDDRGLEAAGAIRALDQDRAREVPIAAIGATTRDNPSITEWLEAPFTPEYMRTRIRAWLLRTPARWVRAPKPPHEEARIKALHRLDILDTEPEERFDRITRLASNLLGAPVSIVSLVDADRQWHKSITGHEMSETSREKSVCAHAILDDQAMVVPDLRADDRFADNPFVSGPPHVRFYAGCPLSLPDGYRVGTLCVLDVKARELSEDQMGLLRDLADLAEEELARKGDPTTS